MALEDHKIGEWTSPVSAEADRPQRSAAEMKAVFDSNSEDLKRALNALIDELSAGSGGDEISMSALDDITAGTLRSLLEAIYAEAKEGVRSEDILAIRLGNVGQLEVTLDGETWSPIAGGGGGGGGDWSDIAALPVAEDIQPPDGFLMYDASLSLPRRALWSKIRDTLNNIYIGIADYAGSAVGTVKRADEAAKLKTARKIGEADFDGTQNVSLANMGAQPASILVENTTVETGAWEDDGTYADYRYRATIPIAGVTSDLYAEIVFAVEDAVGGIYAPVANTYNGGVYIYASEITGSDIVVPTIKVEQVGGGSGGSSYTLPIADANTLGGVQPVAKTETMTQPVGVDANGALYTAPGSGSDYELPVASSATLGGVQPATKTDDMTQPVGVDAAGALFTAPGGGGGGGEKQWVTLLEVTATEDVAEIAATFDEVTEIKAFLITPAGSATATYAKIGWMYQSDNYYTSATFFGGVPSADKSAKLTVDLSLALPLASLKCNLVHETDTVDNLKNHATVMGTASTGAFNGTMFKPKNYLASNTAEITGFKAFHFKANTADNPLPAGSYACIVGR